MPQLLDEDYDVNRLAISSFPICSFSLVQANKKGQADKPRPHLQKVTLELTDRSVISMQF